MLTADRAGDAPAFIEMTVRPRVPPTWPAPDPAGGGPGGHKAYSSRALREHLRRRGSRGGRPPAFDRETHKRRTTAERCLNRLEQ
ncbi:hypothetical protein GCM10010405_50620 [Streptomyces macrosporus]|uniref:Transposase n=1 Tax=Streptomyces macrosporus TaxID=44032 RepID=A0ABP5XQS6_9ACTN